ncbi:XXYS1_4_G0052580.mRNA.1.CDS.1 [Saccharomyces cerevisiae]|nr:EM14S01-3B_G0049850.mRNA.1.CDS.1 [Saccharomyces cerevisiae]CAD6623853.1 XXYS1_4_G0052580.mRNA.1.CDS.1 [Saccharomyces cerevisiae]CAI4443173.1 AMH_1a_G0017320.mRNA.1.CDS.1 [Saccharomyces cerevisiae]CAI6646275.1 AMH_1a_G0017320.mRNA.1.CDS.1 [Saccharomyces cerevisiae]
MSRTSRTTTFVITPAFRERDDEGANSLCKAFLNTFSNLKSGMFKCLLGVGAVGTFISTFPQFFLLPCLLCVWCVCVCLCASISYAASAIFSFSILFFLPRLICGRRKADPAARTEIFGK